MFNVNYEVLLRQKNVTGFWKTDHIVMHEINRISMFHCEKGEYI